MDSRGLTLIELVVVVTILGILAIVAVRDFQTSQGKARDIERKASLHQIVAALAAYASDYGGYPESDAGKIKACGCVSGPILCNFGGEAPGEFCDENNIVYLKEVPGDPIGSPNYCYWSDNTSFKLYAKLENGRDPEAKLKSSCGGATYNFGLSSSNTTL